MHIIMKGTLYNPINHLCISELQFMLLPSMTMWNASDCCYDDLLVLIYLITRGRPL